MPQSRMNNLPSCLAILGPTCSGKSSVALLVAQQIQAEIISCDSMQVYREMDIGTAKPTIKDQELIKHYFIDELDISQPYNANIFASKARELLSSLKIRNQPAVLVGGTGMYAKSLIYDLPLLPSDKPLFKKICQEYEQVDGYEMLKKELLAAIPKDIEANPDTLNNPRRLMRAIEILRISQKLPDSALNIQKLLQENSNFRQFILMPKLTWLREKIPLRTNEMLKSGWLEEVEMLLKAGLLDTPTARQSLGYRDIASYINGTSRCANSAELGELLARKTIQYARRQRTWFKHQHPGSIIIPINDSSTKESITQDIMHNISGC